MRIYHRPELDTTTTTTTSEQPQHKPFAQQQLQETGGSANF